MASGGVVGVPRGSRSPVASLRPSTPPKRPSMYVARLPSRSGTVIPPARQTYARAPRRTPPRPRRSPACSACARHCAAGWPLMVKSMSAPVTATTPSTSTSSVGPAYVTSSPAVSSGLPTSRLPTRNAKLSSAPAGGMPIWYQCRRPRSWTVVNRPGSTTFSMSRLLLAGVSDSPRDRPDSAAAGSPARRSGSGRSRFRPGRGCRCTRPDRSAETASGRPPRPG